MPDLHCSVLKQLVIGDNIVTRWEGIGTHQGEWAGIAPTGNSISVSGISIFRWVPPPFRTAVDSRPRHRRRMREVRAGRMPALTGAVERA